MGSVLIVDDNAAFRAAARAVLETGGYQVAGEAATGAEALEVAATVRPEVALVDIGLPDVDGFTVCRRLHAILPGVVLVLCSVREGRDYTEAIRRSPAVGFLPKSALSASALTRLIDPR